MNVMEFTLETLKGSFPLTMEYDRVFAIGYAGRNMKKTMEHIKELEEQLGVPAPKRIPTIFQCGNYTLTQEQNLHFVGKKTCGEVEYIILLTGGKTYIGIGSDHTDREMESISVPKSKQACAKPIGKVIWDYDELKDHWESILLVSTQLVDGQVIPYQQGTLKDILPVETILAELNERVGGMEKSIIYSGTVPLVEGFRYGEEFRCEMIDEKLGRKLSLAYGVVAISEEER